MTFPCTSCGARLEYAPGTTTLRCPYCSAVVQLPATDRVIEEQDYAAWTAKPRSPVLPGQVLRCPKCAAATETSDISTSCSFCGSPIVADLAADPQVTPEAVVPFGLDRSAAQGAIKGWVGSRWFAPNKLKKVGAAETLKGTYLPHWTYDAYTTTDYSGLRGEHYWVTETYTVMVDGEARTETRQVMHTRWWPASGHVDRTFDDVLVVGTTHLSPGTLEKLAPWSLEGAAPFQPEYLSGYQTLRYDIEPDQGLGSAKQQMSQVIEGDCRSDIGGDEQQVHHMDTSYQAVTFKLMLLPVYLAAYLYAGRTFQVYVNAHTGQVIGERPYSIPKIVAAVVAALVVVLLLVVVYQALGSGSSSGSFGGTAP
jgi:LSD1 subclass zinc finger protein